MKIFKKLLVIVSVLVMSVTLFACKKGSDSSEKPSQSVESGTSNSTSKSNDSSNSKNSVTNPSTEQSNNSQKPIGSVDPGESDNIPTIPVIGENLSYSQKIDAYLDGVTVGDQNFVTAVKNLGEYVDNAPVSSNAIFVAPKGTGDGTINSPMSLGSALWEAKAGQTIYLRGGTYDSYVEDEDGEAFWIGCKGTQNAFITIRNYPGEKVIITNSNSNSSKNNEGNGFSVTPDCAYTVIEGLEFKDIKCYAGYGISMWDGGQNHIVIRNCKIHNVGTNVADPFSDANSGGNGIILFAQNSSKSMNNMFIMNNEIYDARTGWCETLSVTANCEYIYVLANYVHDTTNIGIDFYGNAGYCSNKANDQPRYCVAAGNIIDNSNCDYADCAGLYVDGARDVVLQYNVITNGQYGIEIGSEEKNEQYPVKNILVRSNIVHDNRTAGIRIGGYEQSATGVVYSTTILNNTVYNNTRGGSITNASAQAEIVVAKSDGVSIINNIIKSDNQNNDLITTDFDKNYTKNLSFANNILFVTGKAKNEVGFYMFGAWQEGVDSFVSVVGSAQNTYYGSVTFDAKFVPTYDNSFTAKTGENVGTYDYYLNSRINGTLDIGAVEK